MSETQVDETRKSLERIQSFDTKRIPQVEKLGIEFNFNEALFPAERIINLFSQFPSQYLQELPIGQLNKLKASLDSFYNILDNIVMFDAKENDAYSRRTALVSSLNTQYEAYFDSVHALISYGSSRLRDYSALERDARAAMQGARDRAEQIAKELEGQQQEAQRILDEVRTVAAEQGVSQQASYFKEENTKHEEEALKWKSLTIKLAIGLGIYAALSIFLHKIPGISPNNTYDAV